MTAPVECQAAPAAGAGDPFNCHNGEPGNGGCGGAGLVLVCKEIDFQSTAVVDLRGQDGFARRSQSECR